MSKLSADEIVVAENHFPYGYFVAIPAKRSIYVHAGWSIDEGRWIPGGGSLFKGKTGRRKAEQLRERLIRQLAASD